MQQKFIFAIDIKGIKHLKPLFTDLSTRLCCYLWGGGCVAIAFQESWRLNRAGLARWLIYVLVSNRLRLLRCWPNPRFEPLKPGEEESEGWTWREHPFWRGGGEAGRAESIAGSFRNKRGLWEKCEKKLKSFPYNSEFKVRLFLDKLFCIPNLKVSFIFIFFYKNFILFSLFFPADLKTFIWKRFLWSHFPPKGFGWLNSKNKSFKYLQHPQPFSEWELWKFHASGLTSGLFCTWKVALMPQRGPAWANTGQLSGLTQPTGSCVRGHDVDRVV